jgi:hypothetical protein
MNDADLDRLLKSARVPERAPEHWENFPGKITNRLRRPPETAGDPSPWLSFRNLGWSFAGAALAALLTLGLWHHYGRTPATQFAAAEKCYREISIMFPHQIRDIILNNQGSKIDLADTADLPDAQPIILNICGPNGCQVIITFSGQRVRVGGEECDVLAGTTGNVIVAGEKSVWTSDDPSRRFSQFRIAAKLLNTPS